MSTAIQFHNYPSIIVAYSEMGISEIRIVSRLDKACGPSRSNLISITVDVDQIITDEDVPNITARLFCSHIFKRSSHYVSFKLLMMTVRDAEWVFIVALTGNLGNWQHTTTALRSIEVQVTERTNQYIFEDSSLGRVQGFFTHRLKCLSFRGCMVGTRLHLAYFMNVEVLELAGEFHGSYGTHQAISIIDVLGICAGTLQRLTIQGPYGATINDYGRNGTPTYGLIRPFRRPLPSGLPPEFDIFKCGKFIPQRRVASTHTRSQSGDAVHRGYQIQTGLGTSAALRRHTRPS
jgi:hypothetical protein